MIEPEAERRKRQEGLSLFRLPHPIALLSPNLQVNGNHPAGELSCPLLKQSMHFVP